MKKKIRKPIVWTIIGVVALILMVFATGFSEGIETAIEWIVGGASLLTLIVATMDNNNKGLLTLIGVIGFGITFGLIAWSEHNSSIRRDKEWAIRREENKLKFAEQARQDSIKHIEDSIQHQKDSILIAEESRKLYEREGDTIFGKFLFGMSKSAFDNLKARIDRETGGNISISDYDFKILDSEFHNNKLYSLKLISDNKWTRYYYHDAHEYEEDNDGSDQVQHIIGSFSKKYGKPNGSTQNWHFSHKDISVYATSSYKSREGLLNTEIWAVFISFVQPTTASAIYKAKEEKKRNEEQEKKARENELKRKKEAFGGGL